MTTIPTEIFGCDVVYAHGEVDELGVLRIATQAVELSDHQRFAVAKIREPTVPPELKMETFMLEVSAETREYLTELRSLGTDAQGREVLVGLTFEESKAYIEHGNAQVFGKHVSRAENDRYLELHDKHEPARQAVIDAEVEALNNKSLRH